jgi:hypothetical protein
MPVPQLILLIIQAALSGLSTLKGTTGTDAAMALRFSQIIQSGMQAYEAAAGTPLDLTKIPLQQPVPVPPA